MDASRSLAALAAAASLLLASCARRGTSEEEIRRYPIAGLDGVLEGSRVAFDPDITSDGDGALRITADQPVAARLFETGDLDVEDARLLYRARLRTEDVRGAVYLEMWCRIPGLGEFFSRGLDAPISGTVDWATQEIPFFLQKGQNQDNVKLNLIVHGTGKAWIDDIVLSRGPLR